MAPSGAGGGVPRRRAADPEAEVAVRAPGGELRGRLVRQGAHTALFQGVGFAVRFASTVILARLLTPGDFGLFTMLAGVTLLLMTVSDLGLPVAVVQRRELRHEQVSALFWINVGLSTTAGCLLLLLSPLLAHFYGEPRLVAFSVPFAIGLFAGGLGLQHGGLLSRQLRFRDRAIVITTSQLLGVATGIAAAGAGLSYWSLALMFLASTAARSAGFWIACRWRPGRLRRGVGLRPLLAFGVNLTAAGVLSTVARTLDGILIGWRWRADALGYYNRAHALVFVPIYQLVLTQFFGITEAALSRLQGDPERYRRYYLRALSLVSGAIMPPLALIAVLSRDLVYVSLGAPWLATAPLVAALAVAGLGLPFAGAISWLYVALGRTDRARNWHAWLAAIFALCFVAGLPFGAVGVAIGYAVCLLGTSIPGIYLATRGSPVEGWDTVRATWRPLLASPMVAAVAAAARAQLDAEPSAIALVAGVAAGAGAWLGLFALWPGLRAEILGNVALLRELWPREAGRRNPTSRS